MAEEKNQTKTADKAEEKVAKKKTESKSEGKKAKSRGADAEGLQIDPQSPKVSATKKNRLQKVYEEKVAAALASELGIKNKMEVPRLSKIVVSVCLKDALTNPKALDAAAEELALITGQRPAITRSKKSIAAFKLRKGIALGAMVTLRRGRMYEFYDKLVNVALPRVRDFKGVSPRSFDGRGNYSLGIKEQIIFPEINYDRVDKIRGLNVTVVTTAKSNEQARQLLAGLGMPFRKS